MAEVNEYVLGTGPAELARLGLQHRIWASEASRAWELAGFGPGHRVLDVGCGPGYCTFDLAELVGSSGAVHAVDVSERFIATVRAQAAARGAAHVTAEVGDVARMALQPGSLDGAWSRWVLCFVPDPEAVVRAVAAALRPGAAFVVQDYARYDGVFIAPRSDAFDLIFRAVVASWRDSGGNPRVGEELPAMMERCGLEVESIEPVVRIARPGTLLWQWPRTFFDSFLPGLVEQGRLTPAQLQAFEADWDARERTPGAYFHSPPMVRVIGRRR